VPYDHHREAGNQGDIVEHPALVAALDVVLSQEALERFKRRGHFIIWTFFAGHAWHPLLDESNVHGPSERLRWPDGIGGLQAAMGNMAHALLAGVTL
jgi:hypothetical protein